MPVAGGSGTMALRPDVVATVLEEGAVLLDLESKYFYSLNRSGWAIAQLLEQGATRAQVLARCAAWGMEPGQTAAVDGFLDALVTDRLVETGDHPEDGPDAAAFDGPWQVPSIERQREPLQRIMASAFDPSLPLAE